ncbi:unknown [Prevotella sp. CAG:924]|nr:unknown [Prevotella sp. CAG:924]
MADINVPTDAPTLPYHYRPSTDIGCKTRERTH